MSQNPMTRLEVVEDALSYLDRVKQTFSSTPCVYNDFLDILKKFKAQSIDTPGVISQVSALFNGHPELIEGFNVFLPVGFKVPTGKPENQPYALEPKHSQQAMSQDPSTRLKVENAFSYLDRVKQTFSSTPCVYSDFLDIMKKFKAQSIDTPGVISQVSALFNGYPELIEGFNVFLPVGFKVPTGKPENQPYALEPKPGAMMPATSTVEQGRLGGTGGSQPVEFNDAFNFVNKIKIRYLGKPEVYKKFLDILHAYQYEQKQLKECPGLLSTKTISETDVFNQVSQLFKDQPDLLPEFSKFLPDADVSSSFRAGDNFPTSSSPDMGELESGLLTLFSSSANRKPSVTTPTSGISVSFEGTNRPRLNSTGSAAAVPARSSEEEYCKEEDEVDEYKGDDDEGDDDK